MSSQEQSYSKQGEYNGLAPRLGYISTHPQPKKSRLDSWMNPGRLFLAIFDRREAN